MKFKKSLFAFSSLAMVVAPVATVVACGDDDDDDDTNTGGGSGSTLTIQAESGWVTAFENIIDDFEKDNAQLMEDNGIGNIDIVEMGAFDVETAVTTKGFRDPSVADVYLSAGDKMQFFYTANAAQPYKEANADAFADAQIGSGEAFLPSVQGSAAAGMIGGQMYGVPQNAEAMFGFKNTETADGTLALNEDAILGVYSDLWKMNGLFNQYDTSTNTVEENLRDIVALNAAAQDGTIGFTTSPKDMTFKGATAADADGWKVHLQAGFEAVLTSVDAAGLTDPSAYSDDASVAAPLIQAEWADAGNNAAWVGGPWEQNDLALLSSGVEAAPIDAISNVEYNQWAGGWLYVLNARMSAEEAIVAEALVGEALQSEHAQELYTEAGKISPTEAGKNALGTTDPTVTATYGTNVIARPVTTAFNDAAIFGSYAKIMSEAGLETFAAATNTAATITTQAETLVKAFIAEVAATMAAFNTAI